MSLARPAAVLLLALAGACASAPEDSGSPKPESVSREGMTATIDRFKADGRLGEELWRINLSERFGSSVHATRVTIDGDLVIVEDSDHRIHALDRAGGAHRWFIDLPAATTQVVGGTESSIAFICTDEACAVTRAHGSRMMGDEDAPRTTEHLDFFPSGRAVAIGSSLYVGRLAPFSLQSIDLVAGHAGWSYATASPVMDSVAYGDGPIGQILSITEDGLLFSMPPRDASESAWSPKENWHRKIPGTRPATPLTLVGDHLVFGTENGFLYDVDARNGVVRWKVGCGGDLHGHEATIAGDAVYQHSDGGIKAFDAATGSELWDLHGAVRVITRIGDRVYVDLQDDVVAVVGAASGKEVARFTTGGLSLPTVQGGGSLIACDGTNLFALK